MPRKRILESHKGVFEQVKGAGIWSARYPDAKGRRIAVQVGPFDKAVEVYEFHTTATRLGIPSPADPRRGVKFSEIAADAIAFYQKNRKRVHSFRGMADLAQAEFGNRHAESITTQEFEDWILKLARNGNGQEEHRIT